MHQDVEILPAEDEEILLGEEFEFEIPCEGPRVWPEALGRCEQAAKWIGLKECGHHRLFCEACKQHYLDYMGLGTYFTCGVCNTPGITFIGFELINRARQS